MAKISIKDLRHCYLAEPKREEGWALKRISLECVDGVPMRFLVPRAAVISGLLRPTEGRIFFDDRDVTEAIPEKRHIAQVFQFPVGLCLPCPDGGISPYPAAPAPNRSARPLDWSAGRSAGHLRPQQPPRTVF